MMTKRHDEDAQHDSGDVVVASAVQAGAHQDREEPGQTSDEQVVKAWDRLLCNAFQASCGGDLGGM